MVQIPSEELMPVFCNSNTRCEPIIKIDCVPCPEDLSMCKVNDRCYKIVEYDGSPDTTCGNYRLAAFELRSELNDFMLLFNPATCWDCVKVDQYGNQWRCCDNTNCERKCPLRAGGDAAYWKCDGDEYSTMWPEYEGCISAWISEIQDMAKDIIMEIISIIFSSLSVVSLALTLIALNFVEGSQEERNSIEKHLCFCLLIGHGMALTVLDRSYFHLSQEVCVGVAIFLHYIFLAAFMWMAVEGHLLYRMVVRVFDSGRDFSMIYLCSSYGIPLLVVSITCAITASLQDYGYANDELCWLSTPFYIWAFMGPVVILTGINLVVLVFAMKVAVAASAQQMHSFSERMKIWMKGWFSLSSLLGVTWIFGFFYIQFDHNFAYAFVTLNGLQGIIMFLTRVVFNEQVKSSIKSKAKQKIMMKSFYNFVWNRKDSNAKTSPQPSPWVSRNSLQPNEACSASAIRFGDTTSRCRSSTKHSLSNDSSISTIDSKQNVNPFRPMTSNDSQTLLKIKMKIQNSWGFLRETLLHKNNIEIIVKDFSFKNDVENVEEQNIEC
ncbi:Hypothetical predicted protein [Cloeon dipterum]|uniref:G-protein coupled receptors family 2 profile 2 domain-containing protein n=1 Tax=Cloeon dipterum TaxID=197152 RepID=A0A8S1E0I2_9INSE|nr:Hypothetical predicted protein [Cloeon dipterum]